MIVRGGRPVPPDTYPRELAESGRDCGQESPEHPIATEERRARRRVLERAYPVAKQLAEILDLEDAELAHIAKRLRQIIGSELGSGHGR